MATTTNYGWTTPDDTALVKDGASAIRTLGTSVDTTTKNLNPETTLGDIAYRSSTANVKTRLGIGTTGQILTVAGGVPSWAAAPSSGGMTLISEQTASAVTSVTFGSIAGTYKQLLLVWQGLVLSDQATTFRIRLNNNSGTVYREGGPYQNGGAGMVGSTFSTSSVGGGAVPLVQNVTTETIEKYAKGFLLVDNYASTSKYKVYSYQNNYRKGDNGVDMLVNFQGSFESTTDITSVDIVRTTGTGTLTTDTNTSIRLYGIS